MVEKRKVVIRCTIVGIIFLLLVGTHWFAYSAGVRREQERVATALKQVVEDSQAEALDMQLDYLRLLSKHPQELSKEQQTLRCRKATAVAKLLEASRVAELRHLGDERRAQRYQDKIEQVRQLAFQLCQEK